MSIVNVALKQNAYKIVVGQNILENLGKQVSSLKIGLDAVIITNPIIKKHYGKLVAASLTQKGFTVKFFEVPEGEKSKSAKMAFQLIEKVAQYDRLKRVFIVAMGGGVVGDLAGYVAAAYKRGIPYFQLPTTFLAQIDSAIGGKVGIDLPMGKNLVGAFYQPKVVFSDVASLATLSKRQIRNGLAEAIKYGIIYDKKLFDFIARHYESLLNHDLKALEKVVLSCSKIKAEVVVADEKETKGIRTILNFGHTVGHAIEAAGTYNDYQHGEAIALGMRVAADISYQLKLLSSENVLKINQLLSAVGLPEKIQKIRLADIMHKMQHDKKFQSGKNRFVLAEAIGKVSVVEGIDLKIIKQAIKAYMYSSRV